MPVALRGQIHDSTGWVYDFDADVAEVDRGAKVARLPWADAVASLTEWFDAFDVPLITAHGKDDGRALAMSVRTVELSQAEAASHGITQDVPDGLYAVMDFKDPDALRDYDNGAMPYFSPRYSFGYVSAKGGRVWPVVAREISRTIDPRIKEDHPIGLHEARLTDEGAMPPEVIPEDTAAMAEASGTVEERLSVLELGYRDLAAVVAAMTAKPEAEEVEEVEMSDGSELAALRSEVAKLRGQVKRSEGAAVLATAKVDRDIPAAIEAKFCDVFAENESHARLLIEAIPKRGKAVATGTPINARTAPVAPTVDASLTDGADDLLSRAKRIRTAEKAAGRNITLEAAARIAANGAN